MIARMIFCKNNCMDVFDNENGDDFGNELMRMTDTCILHPVWNILRATLEWKPSVLRVWTNNISFALTEF